MQHGEAIHHAQEPSLIPEHFHPALSPALAAVAFSQPAVSEKQETLLTLEPALSSKNLIRGCFQTLIMPRAGAQFSITITPYTV